MERRHGRRDRRAHPALVTGLAAGAVALGGAPPALAQLAVEPDHVDAAELAGAGNGNGVVEPGEGLALTAHLLSAEIDPVVGLTGTLAVGEATSATLQRATVGWPQLDFGFPAPSAEPFLVTAGTGHACGAPLRFTLALSAAAGVTETAVSVPTGRAGTAPPAQPTTDGAVLIPDGLGGVDQTVTLAGPGTVKGVRVTVTGLQHPYAGDLRLTLTAPDGRSVLLADQRGGAVADGYAGTTFSDAAARDVRTATAPFTGEVRPEQPLAGLDGASAAGPWRLRVEDRSPGGTGVLSGWSLTAPPAVCAAPTPPPPPPPPPPGPVLGGGHGKGHGYGVVLHKPVKRAVTHLRRAARVRGGRR